eukprot:GILJ01018877.1.p1 GENE.GILJ01018877.1~~GILJ01018877.1.p1  ORF type:complete len:331 (-),score=35.45 GILJ01018877.1:359-1321(-)
MSGKPVYVKRDDELGFGLSGSKFRKCRSLVASLKQKQIQVAAVIGGRYSNNVLGLSQLLIENGIRPVLFLKGVRADNAQAKGNLLLTKMFVGENDIQWIDPQQWTSVMHIAGRFVDEIGPRGFLIPEGSSCSASLPGSLTLALDILRNQSEHQLDFSDIFVDAGTSFSAVSLILALSYLQHNSTVHVLPVAPTSKQDFDRILCGWKADFERLIGESCVLPVNYVVHTPVSSASFGPTGAAFDEVAFLARQEGFLTDPIYSAKLFSFLRTLSHSPSCPRIIGSPLVVHSGGAITLSGYNAELIKALNRLDAKSIGNVKRNQ